MAWYVCDVDCQYVGRVYKRGELAEFVTAPPTAFFSASTQDPKTPLPNVGTTDKEGTFYFGKTGWDDLRFPVQGINPPGAARDPSRDNTDGTLVFSASQTNIIAGVAQMPHAWKEGSKIYPHIHWLAGAGGTGNVLWRFEYKIASVGADFPAGYDTQDTLAAAPNSAVKHNLHRLGVIDMEGEKLSSILLWKISRIGGDDTDTFAGTVKLLEFDIHYEIDAIGSGREFEK